MRKRLLISALGILLASCGGGIGGQTKGFYRLGVSSTDSGKNVCVINYKEDQNGTITDYSIDPENFMTLEVRKEYAEKPSNDMPMYLKNIVLRIGNYTQTYPVGGEITTGGITVPVPISIDAKVYSPLIYANVLEDTTEPYAGSATLADKADYWKDVEKSRSFSNGASPITFKEGKPIKDVKVSVDNATYPISNGTLPYPFNGTANLSNGTITINSVNSTLLTLNHTKDINYSYEVSNGVNQTSILSNGVVPNSVKIENSQYGLSAVDDGNGHLNGNINGTIDYSTGQLTLSIPLNELSDNLFELTKDKLIKYESIGTIKLPYAVKPLTLTMEADGANGTAVGFCSDDGRGNLTGDCSGTINYNNGTVQYRWDSSTLNAFITKLTYEHPKPIHLTTTWNTNNKNVSVTADYETKADNSPMMFSFYIPSNILLNNFKLHSGWQKFTDYKLNRDGNILTITLNKVPSEGLSFSCILDKILFNFNPNVHVTHDPSLSKYHTVNGTVTVHAELSDGEKLDKTIPISITGKSCKE